MAVELRNALGPAIGKPLPATLLFDYPTLESLGGYLGRLLIPADEAADVTPAGAAERGPDASGIDELSDAEAEALLLEELEAAKKRRAHD
jgi:hypothetical protein